MQQFNAIFRKNLALQRRQWLATIRQMFIPVILVSIIGLLQVIVDRQLSQMDDLVAPSEFDPLPLYETFRPEFLQDKDPLRGVPYFRAAIGGSGDRGRILDELGYFLWNGTRKGFFGNLNSTNYYKLSDDAGAAGLYFPNIYEHIKSPAEMNQDLIDIFQFWKDLLGDKEGFGPMKPKSAHQDMKEYQQSVALQAQQLLNAGNDWQKMIFEMISSGNYTILPPIGAIVVNDLSIRPEAEKKIVDFTLRPGGRYGGWKPARTTTYSPIQKLYPEVDRIGNLLSLMNNAFSKSVFGENGPVILTSYQGLPQKVVPSFDISTVLGIFLLGFSMTYLLPMFIANIVIDKHEKILLMMELSGLKLYAYWTITVLYNMFTYCISIAALWLTGIAFKMRFFTQTDPLLLIPLFLLWGLSLNMLAFFFASFFKTPRTASILGYFVVIFSVMISNFLNTSVFLQELPPLWYFMYPPFAFYRSLFVMGDACIRLQCLTIADIFNSAGRVSFMTKQMGLILLMMLLTTFLYGLIAWLRRRVNYETDYSSSSFVESIRNFIRSFSRRLGKLASTDDSTAELGQLLEADDELQMDEDVLNMRKEIMEHSSAIACESALLINGLTKTFGNGHTAVKEMYLSLDKGECFGLLGANGAGKTTLISCLTGLKSVSSGTALFANGTLDLTKNVPEIQSKLGVCLQFDVLYPILTPKEHLYFYARLKGVKEGQELHQHVRDILHSVGLSDFANRPAKHLSGGMRRRLSMGIAMTGTPDLIILDEPSTGLDPKTRREVWNVFSEMKNLRKQMGTPVTVILTTHDMEEADELCDRIGIMSKGIMRCIGTSDHLKSKYDVGFILTLQVSDIIKDSDVGASMADLISPENHTPPIPLSLLLKQYLEHSLDDDDDVTPETSGQETMAPLASFITKHNVKVQFLPEISLNNTLTYRIHKANTETNSQVSNKLSSISFMKNFFSVMSNARNKVEIFIPANLNAIDSACDMKNVVISEWGLNSTSLEDVFVQIVKNSYN